MRSGILHQRRLGDLELERRRRDAVRAERVAHLIEKAALLQLAQRQVQRHAARRRHRALPRAVVGADAVQHPIAELQDEIRFLGERHEVRRKHEAALGQVPAQQRFDAFDAPRRDAVLRLVVQAQLVALERAAQLALQHQPLDGLRIHVARVVLEAVAAGFLRLVQRRVGVANQVDDVVAVARVDRDTHARREEDLLAVHLERLAGRRRAAAARARSDAAASRRAARSR